MSRKKVFITGAAGYVASRLIPMLNERGYEIIGVDVAQYDWNPQYEHPNFLPLIADIRNTSIMAQLMNGCDYVIHLACISNDPSFDLDPELGRSINYDCFKPLVKAAKFVNVKRFIFASSSSVYGIKSEKDVTENLVLEPLTDYSKYKAMCEPELLAEINDNFEVVIIRPATVCGNAPALRLDLCVHILTMAALTKGEISVYGGAQYRPNIHIEDICEAYVLLLEAPKEKVNGKIFNCGAQNFTIQETAEIIRDIVDGDISINITPTNDNRSYHVSSDKIGKELGFYPEYSVEQAIIELESAYRDGLIANPDDDKYYRIRSFKKLGLSI